MNGGDKPLVFVGSSVEGLPVAKAVARGLRPWAEPRVWNERGVFRPGLSNLHNLTSQLRQYHGAVLVFSPDDTTVIRGERYLVARDNVVFELGLFMGALPTHRVLFLVPNAKEPFHKPTDLGGIVHGVYDAEAAAKAPEAAVADFCDDARAALCTPQPGEKAPRVVRGPMQIRNLRSIGRAGAAELDQTYSYDVKDAVVVIDGDRVSLRGKIKMSGRGGLDGLFSGYGEFSHGGAYVIYTVSSPTDGREFKGVAYVRVPSYALELRGYWMAEPDQVGPDVLAVGEIEIRSISETQTFPCEESHPG